MLNRSLRELACVGVPLLFTSIVIAQPGSGQRAPIYQAVTRGDVAAMVVERGEIDAVNSVAVSCKVRATKGNAAASTIVSLVEEGTHVKKGDIVARLDDTVFRDRLEQGQIAIKEKQSLIAHAEADLRLAELQGQADTEAADATVDNAEADLKRFIDGDADQLRKLEIKLQQAKVALQIAQARFNRSAAKAEATELRLEVQFAEGNVEAAEIDLKKQRERDPAVKRQLEAKLRQAKISIEAGKLQLARKRAQHEAQVAAAKAALQMEESRFKELRDDLDNCALRAPSDGVVIYHRPDMSRFGGAQSVIAVGETVREGQRLLSIPDLSEMQVRIKINEAIVSRVAVGQKAVVRVDAMPGKEFLGIVRSVIAVASVGDWNTRDVRLYPATVVLDGRIEGLKPGMTAQAAVLLEHRKDVLRIPIEAVVRDQTGSYCYVQSNAGPSKRQLVLAAQDQQHAEVKEGVKEGENVLTNPPKPTESQGGPARSGARRLPG